ncbi:MAG: hypothetical protein QW412_02415 [Candidatus Aenigmatarchaeota archaeon]
MEIDIKGSLPLQVLIFLFIVFFIRQMVYYFSVGGKVDIHFISDSLFFVAGIIAAFFSLTLSKQLKTQQELSMISLFLSIKEFKNEVKNIYISSFIAGASFFTYSFLYTTSIFSTEGLKSTAEIWASIFAVISPLSFLLFIIFFVFMVRKWKRRFEKYGGTF